MLWHTVSRQYANVPIGMVFRTFSPRTGMLFLDETWVSTTLLLTCLSHESMDIQ